MNSQAAPARIIELTSRWTRSAGRMLMGLGHEVVLVEAPDSVERRMRGGVDFAHWHAGKKSVVLDPERDRADWERLCATADVLLDGTVPGEPLPFLPPGLPLVRVSPFGATGPDATRPATDLTVAARGGMLSRVGSPSTPPLRLPQNQAEQLAGVHAAIAVEMVLRAHRRGLAVPQVDIAAIECVAASLETGVLSYLHQDQVEPRPGRHHPKVPHGLFQTRDGFVGGGLGGNERMWRDTLAWLTDEGGAGGLADPRWQSASERKSHRYELFDALAELLTQWDAHEWVEQAQQRRLPWAVVDGPQGVQSNPQLRDRDFFLPIGQGDGASVDTLGLGFQTRQAGPDVVHVPALDEHRQIVLTDREPKERPTVVPPTAGVLAGVRVVDLTWVLAGPYCTRILADLGAEVIKIESRNRPDPTRFSPDMHLSRDDSDDPDTSGYFNEYNRNKRSITLDTRTDEGLAILREVIASADVVVENFSATVMKRMGLSWPELRALNPELIYLSMSGMGHTGPRAHWVTYADIVSAASGLTALTGWNADELEGVIYGHGDIVAGLQGALAVSAALRERDLSGEGQHIDLSQLEAIVSHMGTMLVELAQDPTTPPQPIGNADPEFAPHGVFQAAGPDKWVALAVRSNAEWQALCRALGEPDLAEDETLHDPAGRRSTAVHELIAQWVRVRPPDQAVDALQAAGVAAEVVQNATRVVADPQLRHRQFYSPIDHPRGVHITEGSPLAAGLGLTQNRPAPLLGADTDQVLQDLGIDDTRRDELRAKDVLS